MAVSKFVHEARAKAAPGTFLSQLPVQARAPRLPAVNDVSLYPPNQHAYIYCLRDPRDGAVRYVGKSFNVQGRLSGHRSGKGNAYCARWIRSLLKIGLEPQMDVIDLFPADGDEWQSGERFWITTFRAMGFKLTNLDEGGMAGNHHHEETKRKIGLAHKGKTVSEESRLRMRKACSEKYKRHPELRERLRQVAQNMSQEQRDKIALAATNISDETRAKMSASAKARANTPEGRLRLATTKGRKLSPEHRAKIGASQIGKKGRVLTEEARKRISETLKARHKRIKAGDLV